MRVIVDKMPRCAHECIFAKDYIRLSSGDNLGCHFQIVCSLEMNQRCPFLMARDGETANAEEVGVEERQDVMRIVKEAFDDFCEKSKIGDW